MWPQKPGSAEDEIRSVMAQIRIASLEGDTDKVSNLLTDEYVQTDISGHVQDKQKQRGSPYSHAIHQARA
jgi:hypothetical protein